MLSLRLQTTMHRKKILFIDVFILSDNTARVKTLCNVVLVAPDNNAQKKFLFNDVLILLGHYCTSKYPMQCCPWDSRQHCTRKKSCSMLSQFSYDNIALVTAKTLCNVAQESQDNNAQEKILFNVVLIFLGQHCTGKNFVQCCPRDSRQHCRGKNPVQCLNITFRQFLFWTG